MEYALYNFKIYKGIDKYIPFIFYSLNNEEKVYENFTNSNFLLTVKDSYNGDVVDILTNENNRIKLGIINESNTFEESVNSPYALEVYFPHEVTKKLDIPLLVYDLFRIVDDKHEVLLHGNIKIIQGVSYE